MTDTGNYAARATALRETAKWIAAVFAGTGAVLFSGLSFTNLEKIADTDGWVIPVALATVPIFAAAVAVRTAASVISEAPPTTPTLLPRVASESGTAVEVSPMRDQIEALLPATVAIYGGIGPFEDRLVDANARVAEAEAVVRDQATPENQEALDVNYNTLKVLQDGVQDLVVCADFLQVRDRYDKARWTLLGAAVVGVLAAAASGVLAAQQARKEADAPESTAKPLAIADPTSVRVHLVAPAKSAPCRVGDGETATAIGGTYVRPLLLFEPKAASSDVAEECRVPWRWQPEEAEVVVVPTGVQ